MTSSTLDPTHETLPKDRDLHPLVERLKYSFLLSLKLREVVMSILLCINLVIRSFTQDMAGIVQSSVRPESIQTFISRLLEENLNLPAIENSSPFEAA